MNTQQETLDTATEPAATPTVDADSDGDLQLSYQSNGGNTIVIRTYVLHGSFLHEIDEELMYNFSTEQWETAHRHTYDHKLADDGETLVGDGSNWDGAGRNWENYFTERHYERLELRFPYDDIPNPRDDIDDHNPVDRPN